MLKKIISKGLHKVIVQTGAGQNSSFPDGAYEAVGATLVDSAADIYQKAELLLKVQSPTSEEAELLRRGQVWWSIGV